MDNYPKALGALEAAVALSLDDLARGDVASAARRLAKAQQYTDQLTQGDDVFGFVERGLAIADQIELSPAGASRDHAVPCLSCRQLTFNHSARCDRHLLVAVS